MNVYSMQYSQYLNRIKTEREKNITVIVLYSLRDGELHHVVEFLSYFTAIQSEQDNLSQF